VSRGALQYRSPPPELSALVAAPLPPVVRVAPGGRHVALLHPDPAPPLARLVRPWLGLAGMRVDVGLGTHRRPRAALGLEIVSVADGARRAIGLPAGSRVATPRWSPDGERLAFLREGDAGMELWVAEASSAEARRLCAAPVNDLLCEARWEAGGDALLAPLVPAGRGSPPPPPVPPTAPIVEESCARESPIWTIQDLLRSAHDEALFEHYVRSELVRVALDGSHAGRAEADLHAGFALSPDGEHLLTAVLEPPWSHVVAVSRFGRRFDVRSGTGAPHTVLRRALAEAVPIEGVPEGPRGVDWQPLEPAVLTFVEALDGGDPRRDVPARDRLLRLEAPFDGAPATVLRTAERLVSIDWTERRGELLATEYDRERRWLVTEQHVLEPAPRRVRRIFDRSSQDVFADPGTPLRRVLPDGRRAVEVRDDCLHLVGAGAGPDGERPFLDRMRLADGGVERLLESPPDRHERVLARHGSDAGWITVGQSPSEPPDLWLRLAEGAPRRLTRTPDPHPELSGAKRRLLRYEREDGVPLSAMLHLPAVAGRRDAAPLLLWAYPLEFNDADTAGQVRAAPSAFRQVTGLSPLAFLARGYAVLTETAMPVVGPPETANDRFVEQVVANAEAALSAVAAAGGVDTTRVAVAGRSYGAFMTAHLLAHTRLFRCGVAISGAYNRSLTPFGFQRERRSLWQAPETYVRMSPFFAADRIEAPLLLLHGAVDENAGSQTFQSRRLYEALRGLGRRARLVLLPGEGHATVARESVAHALAEISDWLDAHLQED